MSAKNVEKAREMVSVPNIGKLDRRRYMSKRRAFTIVTVFFLVLALSTVGCNGGGNKPVIIESGPRIGMVTTTEAVVSWDLQSSSHSAVSYRVAGESGFTGKVLSSKEAKRHSVTITNLKPGTLHEYQVDGHPTVGSFRTATTDDTQFVFVSMADNRGPTDKDDIQGLPQSFKNIISDAVKRSPVFAVNAGDLFYGKNPDISIFKQLYQSFKNAIQSLASITPYLISPGNHEMSPFKSSKDPVGFDPVALFNEEFPQPGLLPGYEGFVFSWDWGKVHFVSIATNHFDSKLPPPHYGMYRISDAQITWLDTDLQNAKSKGAQFIIVFGHSNAYIDPSWPESDPPLADLNNTDPQQRDKFWAILAKHKADVYVCGHRHFFDDSITKDGVVQWMNGNSGSVVGGPNEYTVWTVNGNTIKAELVNDAGQTTHTRTFTK